MTIFVTKDKIIGMKRANMNTINKLHALAKYGTAKQGYTYNNAPYSMFATADTILRLLHEKNYLNSQYPHPIGKRSIKAIAILEPSSQEIADGEVSLIVFSTAQTYLAAIEDFCDILDPLLADEGILADVQVCEYPTPGKLDDFASSEFGQEIAERGMFLL